MNKPNAISLVLDQGIPRDAAALLRALNYDCLHVGEIGMWSATDQEILAFAAEKKSTIVTLDADFHAMLAVSGNNQPSVIRIRLQGLRAPETCRLVQQVLVEFVDELRRGAVITLKARKTTCHILPIGKDH